MKYLLYEGPRNCSGQELIKALKVYGYVAVCQNGSHITVTTQRNGEHHLAIPNHNPIKILNGIISRVASHLGGDYTKEKILMELLGPYKPTTFNIHV
jgi:predicted RNA binding protein YcfA (HicA-like mRNA interferase family)